MYRCVLFSKIVDIVRSNQWNTRLSMDLDYTAVYSRLPLNTVIL